ncbi:uncharacterized protein LOC131853080 [Achroia grisella]|uniref:uncharacterized protein LOC131853080 n=1 Tax=Achroia grisella TaxID=688607 RepID=UPI0027D2C418|nr:uncharacterized protein LOC131853080 [Achroia grisella]
MSRLLAFVVLIATQTLVRTEPQDLCQRSYCECKPAIHQAWNHMNCTMPSHQVLNIKEGDIPKQTIYLVITGASSVTFEANSLSELDDIRKIHLLECSTIILKKSAAVKLQLVNGLLEIEDCNSLIIESNTFTQIKGPLSVNIRNCYRASIEGTAFSWLFEIIISDIGELTLGDQSFMRDLTTPNTKHGPDMKIEIRNVSIPIIPKQAFGHSAAKIMMELVDVGVINTAAFSGNTYSNITAINCTFGLIEKESFSAKTQIEYLSFIECEVKEFSSKALLSAIENLHISQCRFENIEKNAISATVVSVAMLNNVFHKFMERGLEFLSLTTLQMERNIFDELPTNAIVAPDASIHNLIFTDNEIETINPNSLGFIGETIQTNVVEYKHNYYGIRCYCNVTQVLNEALGVSDSAVYENESYCTVEEFPAKCFNVHDQNMILKRYITEICEADTVKCGTYENGSEIKNPRFPHKSEEDEGLSGRNKKVIGIVIVTILGCIVIALFISFIKWMRFKGYCVNVKNFLISSNSSCGTFCDRLCTCNRNNSLDNARSISQLSVNEYSERHCLNEPRRQDLIQETALPETYVEEPLNMDDKTTQTLPEELTKELLENLKTKLEDPENYVEAREMIEHLYELIKVEESCNTNSRTPKKEENIYELPFQNTTPRIGKNKKQMISVGTRTPSLDKLLPLSPYNRQTALAHEYFEPKDLAVHLYAEIANSDKEKKIIGAIPDVIAEQAEPRGPYLRAVREKMSSASPTRSQYNGSSKTTPRVSPITSPMHMSIKSNKSNSSNSSSKMLNRPLPEKPTVDPGEGPSYQHG